MKYLKKFKMFENILNNRLPRIGDYVLCRGRDGNHPKEFIDANIGKIVSGPKRAFLGGDTEDNGTLALLYDVYYNDIPQELKMFFHNDCAYMYLQLDYPYPEKDAGKPIPDEKELIKHIAGEKRNNFSDDMIAWSDKEEDIVEIMDLLPNIKKYNL